MEQRENVRAGIERRMEDSPWALLAIAAAAGYVAGGGLFSPLTRYLSRIAVGALLVPSVRARARGAAAEARAAFEGSDWESQQHGSRPEPGF